MCLLAIDFGTSRIKAAIWDDKKQKTTVLATGGDGKLFIPSLFHISSEGVTSFGDSAARMVQFEPLGLLDGVKLRFDERKIYLPNGQVADSVTLLSLVIKGISGFTERTRGIRPTQLILTLPPTKDGYRSIYEEAATEAGFSKNVSFMTEPEAAIRSWCYTNRPDNGSVISVIDIGGGTTDWGCFRYCTGSDDVEFRLEQLGYMSGQIGGGSHVDIALFNEMAESMSSEGLCLDMITGCYRPGIMAQIRSMKELSGAQNLGVGVKYNNSVLYDKGLSFPFPKDSIRKATSMEVISKLSNPFICHMVKALRDVDIITPVSILTVGGMSCLPDIKEQLKGIIKDISHETGHSCELRQHDDPSFACVTGAVVQLETKPGIVSPDESSNNNQLSSRTFGNKGTKSFFN